MKSDSSRDTYGDQKDRGGGEKSRSEGEEEQQREEEEEEQGEERGAHKMQEWFPKRHIRTTSSKMLSISRVIVHHKEAFLEHPLLSQPQLCQFPARDLVLVIPPTERLL
jgi:hypothetical protein